MRRVGAGGRRGVVVSLEEWRLRRRALQRLSTEEPPEKLVDDVLDCDVQDYIAEELLGTDPEWDEDDYDAIRMAVRLTQATGLHWPVMGRKRR